MLADVFHASHPELNVLCAELEGATEEEDSADHDNEKYLKKSQESYLACY